MGPEDQQVPCDREGFELVAMARALVHDPGLVARYQAGEATVGGGVPCNRCVAEMERPGEVRCARPGDRPRGGRVGEDAG